MPNEQQREVWNSPNIGKEWSGTEPISDVATPMIFEALDLRPGERVLDLACGGGKTTVRAAQAVGESGRVTGVDISAGMIRLAGERIEEAGLSNVQLAVRDAQTDAFPGAPFDAVLSQLGIMFFDDTVAALTNVRGHLRPGGRAVFVVWQPEQQIPWFPGHVMAPFMPQSDEPDTAERAASLGDPANARRVLEEAGFANVRAELRNVDAEVSADYEIPQSLTVATVAKEHQEALRVALAEQRAGFIDGEVGRLFCPMVLLTADAPM